MKLHIVKHSDGDYNFIDDIAYIKKDTADNVVQCMNEINNYSYWTEEVELPFIGRSVCYIHGYYGIGGGFGSPMRHIIHDSQIYACIEDAKSDNIWLKAVKKTEQEPGEKYYITDTMIATDHFGEPFDWGYDGFNVQIKRIRVIKA